MNNKIVSEMSCVLATVQVSICITDRGMIDSSAVLRKTSPVKDAKSLAGLLYSSGERCCPSSALYPGHLDN